MIRSPRSSLAGPVLGGLFGAIAYGCSLGTETLDPRFIDWVMVGDWRIHFLGWHTFRAAPWAWPLGVNSLFGYPVGTSVALTDSMPALAIAFKLLDPILPGRFQYIGPWLAFCFVMQGVFGALLTRLVTSSLVRQIFGAAVFVAAPVLVHRVGHPALAAHWLLLAALWLHVRGARSDEALSGRVLIAWAAVVALSAAMHVYITFMVMAIATAHFAGTALTAGREAWRPMAAVAALSALTALVFWQCGYFIVQSAGALQAEGFGALSVNVLAPIAPLEEHARLGPWLLPRIPQEYEGYAYLGVGVILLAIGAIAACVRWTPHLRARPVLRHAPLAVAMLILWAMAIGPDVTVGETTAWHYDESWWGPLTVFRANGRMVWPLYYTVVFAAVAGLSRVPGRLATAVLALAAVLQVMDVSRAYAQAREYKHRTSAHALNDDYWDVVPQHYRHLVLAPTVLCSPDAIDFEPFALLAGDTGATINAGLAARYDIRQVREYCRTLEAQIAAGELPDDTLLVLHSDMARASPQYTHGPFVCVDLTNLRACVAAVTYQKWQDAYDATRHVVAPVAELETVHGVLAREYARMGRSEGPAPGTARERIEAIRMYLVYRTTGCSDEAAREKVFRTLRGEPVLRACGNPVAPRLPMPPREETVAFRADLGELLQSLGRAPQGTTIDAEGEAVWLQEYARLRLAGRGDEEARHEVIARIRQIAGR